jgi:hypothetical protein
MKDERPRRNSMIEEKMNGLKGHPPEPRAGRTVLL